jgi:hypothetical protein
MDKKRKADDYPDDIQMAKRTKAETIEMMLKTITELQQDVTELKKKLDEIYPYVNVPRPPTRTREQLIADGRCPNCRYADYNCVCD